MSDRNMIQNETFEDTLDQNLSIFLKAWGAGKLDRAEIYGFLKSFSASIDKEEIITNLKIAGVKVDEKIVSRMTGIGIIQFLAIRETVNHVTRIKHTILKEDIFRNQIFDEAEFETILNSIEEF